MSDRRRPVVVTGAAGFVGAHVMRGLVVSGRTVVATDVVDQPPQPALTGLDTGQLAWIAGDLTQATTIDRLLDAAAGEPCDVVHVAARIQLAQLGQTLGESVTTPSAALRSLDVNAMASWRLCTTFAERGALGRLVHVSTRSVFGGRPATVEPIAEDAPQQPAGVYGSSKAAAELGLLAVRAHYGIDLVVARITGVFGPWQGPVSFIGQAVESVVAGRPHRTATGADDAYELTYVKDTARGLTMLVDADRLDQAVYHVASGGRLISLDEVAAAFSSADPTSDVEFGPGANAGAAGRTPLDVARMRDELGFTAQWSLVAAIADYLRVERTGEYGPEIHDPAVATITNEER